MPLFRRPSDLTFLLANKQPFLPVHCLLNVTIQNHYISSLECNTLYGRQAKAGSAKRYQNPLGADGRFTDFGPKVGPSVHLT